MKNRQALIILFIANGISGFAQGISMLSIPWYFKQQDQSSLFIAFFAAVTLGSLFWGLYAGTLVDGFNRKDVFLGTNFIAGLVILSVASLGFKEGILPIVLIILVFTTTFFGYHIHYPNLYAFAQEITDPKDYTRVTSYIEIVGQTTSIGAAAMGAVLLEGIDTIKVFSLFNTEFSFPIFIRRWELYEIFLLNGLAHFLSFGIIFFIHHKPVKDLFDMDEGDLKERLISGYNYLKKNKLVNVFGICSYSIFIITIVEIFCLRPVYINNHLQEGGDALGLSELMYASGSLLSGVIISKLLKKIPIPGSIIILTFLTAAAFFLCAFSKTLAVFYFVSLVVGFTNAGSRIFRVSYLFNLIPNELTGRVNSIFNVANTIFRMVFILIFIFPFFSQGSNVTYAYLILGSFTVLAGVLLLFLYKRLLNLTSHMSGVEPLPH